MVTTPEIRLELNHEHRTYMEVWNTQTYLSFGYNNKLGPRSEYGLTTTDEMVFREHSLRLFAGDL